MSIALHIAAEDLAKESRELVHLLHGALMAESEEERRTCLVLAAYETTRVMSEVFDVEEAVEAFKRDRGDYDLPQDPEIDG